MPQTETTVLSQLAMQIFGDNAAFYFVQATTVMPKRSPLTVNILGIYLSLDIEAANIGKAVNPVLAANTKIITVQF
jgi:hypothetical protein